MIYICDFCNQQFSRSVGQENKYIKNNKNYKIYCSTDCKHLGRTKRMDVLCKNCNKKFSKREYEIKKTNNNNFCSKSCSATFNNKNKQQGTRISKLEIWLQSQLLNRYPSLEIQFNKKDAINSELDIYIPSLKLAFELNGIFHYEPIYGAEKLSQIQNNDHRKFQACGEKGISLCIIDTSKQKRFTEKSSQQFLEIIVNIINSKLGDGESNSVLKVKSLEHHQLCFRPI